jgi:hypothetical protein
MTWTPTSRRALLAATLAGLLMGCPDPDPPAGDFSLSASARDEGWCVGPGQYVASSGECLCNQDGQRYDQESTECVACQADSCAGKECGSDGCQGTCGACSSGSICVDGACQACTPSCEGKSCGDDGCGGTCGSGPCGATTPDDGVVTPCTCATAPPLATPGAIRQEPRCASGFAQFEVCGVPCGHSGVSWGETCTEALACNQILVGCNCGFPPRGAFRGATAQTDACQAGYAIFGTCDQLFCSPTSVAWAIVCGC